jgi:hypothetical protein
VRFAALQHADSRAVAMGTLGCLADLLGHTADCMAGPALPAILQGVQRGGLLGTPLCSVGVVCCDGGAVAVLLDADGKGDSKESKESKGSGGGGKQESKDSGKEESKESRDLRALKANACFALRAMLRNAPKLTAEALSGRSKEVAAALAAMEASVATVRVVLWFVCGLSPLVCFLDALALRLLIHASAVQCRGSLHPFRCFRRSPWSLICLFLVFSVSGRTDGGDDLPARRAEHSGGRASGVPSCLILVLACR